MSTTTTTITTTTTTTSTTTTINTTTTTTFTTSTTTTTSSYFSDKAYLRVRIPFYDYINVSEMVSQRVIHTHTTLPLYIGRELYQRLFITRRVTSRFNMGRHFEFMERQGPSDRR